LIIKSKPYLCSPKNNERRYFNVMIIINIKDGESLDKALKRFKKKFEKTGVLRELRSRQAYEKKSVTRRTLVKHAIYKQNMQLEGTI
jgi:small subunit ribosomal protein S21